MSESTSGSDSDVVKIPDLVIVSGFALENVGPEISDEDEIQLKNIVLNISDAKYVSFFHDLSIEEEFTERGLKFGDRAFSNLYISDQNELNLYNKCAHSIAKSFDDVLDMKTSCLFPLPVHGLGWF